MITKLSYEFAKWFYENYRNDISFSPIAMEFHYEALADIEDQYVLTDIYGTRDEDKYKLIKELKGMYKNSATLMRCIEYLIDENIIEGKIQNWSSEFYFRELRLTSLGVRMVEGAKFKGESIDENKQKSAAVFNFSLINADNVGLVNASSSVKVESFGFLKWIKSKVFRE